MFEFDDPLDHYMLDESTYMDADTKQVGDGFIVQTGGLCDFKIVGESHYTANFEIILGPRRRAGYEQHFTAIVELEPANKFDKNAVKVSIQGMTVGYFPRHAAKQFQKFLRQQGITDTQFPVDAIVVGGRTGQNFGVWVAICHWGANFSFHHSGKYDDIHIVVRKRARLLRLLGRVASKSFGFLKRALRK